MLKIITRAEAKALGLKRYFTGKPCKRGHVCERKADDGCCLECARKLSREWQRERRKAVAVPRVIRCIVCEKNFVWRRPMSAHRKTCSHECLIENKKRNHLKANEAYRRRNGRLQCGMAECNVCGREFKQKTVHQVRCGSRECWKADHRRFYTVKSPKPCLNCGKLCSDATQNTCSPKCAKENINTRHRICYWKNIERNRERGRVASHKSNIKNHYTNGLRRIRRYYDNIELHREKAREAARIYKFTLSVLLEMGLITKEDSPKEQRGLVRAYQELGLISKEEIEEWLNTQTLKKA
jgi:hypothetical protein